jgi:hypothetical protein
MLLGVKFNTTHLVSVAFLLLAIGFVCVIIRTFLLIFLEVYVLN